MSSLPYTFQLHDVRIIHRMGGRVLISHEMGLGKCFLSLMYAHRHPEQQPVIIVCPASLKWMWEAQAKEHFNMRAEILEGFQPWTGTRLTKSPLLIINYDILEPNRKKEGNKKASSWVDWLKDKIKPQLIILDEVHFCGSRTSKRTKAVRKLCHGIPHVLALSGTPLQNRPAELWPTLNILRPDLFPSFWPFAMSWCNPRRTPWGWDLRGASNLKSLHKLLLDKLMIRRLKSEVLAELPAKQRTTIPIALSTADEREYEEAKNGFVRWLYKTKGKKFSTALALVKLGYLKRLAGQFKLPMVMEWIDNFLATTDEKIVVFAIHKTIVKALWERYKKLCVVVDGSTPNAVRQSSVAKFQGDRKCRVFIGNVQAAGVGITLTASSTVLFAELGWKPAEHTQAEDRCHRIGTKGNVQCVYMIAKGTIEESLVRLLTLKQKVINQVLDGEGRGDDLPILDLLLKELRKEG